MPLKDCVKVFKSDRLVNYFGGPSSESTIDKNSVERSCEHDDRYVSR